MNETIGKGPGRNYRNGVTMIQLAQKFPNEEADRVWVEKMVWPNGRICPMCKSTDTYKISGMQQC